MEGGDSNNNNNNNNNNNSNNNTAVDVSVSGGGAASGYSRWNPTKEQIDMLEGLYKQGIRTPSAEQIQQITARLRAFGHIEGKNVFYWFQNHKARQRQKQKQDTISYFNRFVHHHHRYYNPITTTTTTTAMNTNSITSSSGFSPYPNNNVCIPFCTPYTDFATSHHHQQQPKVLLPRALKRKPLPPEKMAATVVDNNNNNSRKNQCNNRTLDLFPLQPTGDLLQARTQSSGSLASIGNSASSGDSGNIIPSTPETSSSSEGGGNGHIFFDFFCGNYGHCETH